jgi:hypothetical protein
LPFQGTQEAAEITGIKAKLLAQAGSIEAMGSDLEHESGFAERTAAAEIIYETLVNYKKLGSQNRGQTGMCVEEDAKDLSVLNYSRIYGSFSYAKPGSLKITPLACLAPGFHWKPQAAFGAKSTVYG